MDTAYGFRAYVSLREKNDRFEFKRARTPSSVVLQAQAVPLAALRLDDRRLRPSTAMLR